MLLPWFAALALLAQEPPPQGPPPGDVPVTTSDTARPRPPIAPALLESAYLDAGARELVARARQRRRVVDRSIDAYSVLVRERISLGLRALRRERLVFQREVASRVEWQREGPIRIEVLGAREVIPIALPGARVPSDLDEFVPHLPFEPGEEKMLLNWDDEDNDIHHPLGPRSEEDYRFRSGDTTVVRLPDGRSLRLIELEILPRRKTFRLVRGSFWIDSDSHAVVQATLRLADDYDLEEAEPHEAGDIPGFLKPIRARVQYVTIEYGLWDFRWWLPRIVAFEGVATIGRLVSLPLRFEREYTGYEVSGAPEPVIASRDSILVDSAESAESAPRCPRRFRITVRVGGEVQPREEDARGDTGPAEDSARAVADSVAAAEGGQFYGFAYSRRRDELTPEQIAACERYVVDLPADSSGLLTSELLSPSAFSFDEAFLSDDELREVRAHLEDLAPTPWQVGRTRFAWGLGAPGLVRYNRIEGLSLGARLEMDLGRLTAAATARLGAADLEPNGELEVQRETYGSRQRLAAYRRLVPMDPEARPFSVTESLSSLLLGRDEADYYRALGVELTGAPAASRSQWYDWRLFAQRERAAFKETDFSVRRLLDGGYRFEPNLEGDDATQYGAALGLHGWWGHDPVGFRGGIDATLEAAAGSFDYARPSITVRAGFPLPGKLVGALEAAGGTMVGGPGVQHLWSIGGPATLRGYRTGALRGESFLRGRAEVGNRLPAVRLVLFGDIGWAGSFESISEEAYLASMGVGAGFLDGLVRLDLARALRAPTGWRLTAQVDAPL